MYRKFLVWLMPSRPEEYGNKSEKDCVWFVDMFAVPGLLTVIDLVLFWLNGGISGETRRKKIVKMRPAPNKSWISVFIEFVDGG